MSTIAYRNGVMAADSNAYGGRYVASPGFKKKVHRITSGRFTGGLAGISSSCVGVDATLLAWIMAGAEPLNAGEPVPSDFHVMLIDSDGQMWIANDNMALSGPIESKFYAIGGGSDFAIGAMEMGAGPERAVEVAMVHDHHSGGPVYAMPLHAEA